ncbi:MAG: four helix bundle protein [Lentisphaerae bacterium]|nr:four helix bundle protein [Lentisphaerota bacterium]
MDTNGNRKLLLPSGGYGKLKSFQIAQLIYDITVHFVELYVPIESRTRDQMVQAARFGVQNIAEGSIDAATSVKLELNLYNVARASLEELRLDYRDYLRQHNYPIWTKDSILYQNFIGLRISDKAGFKSFIRQAESSGAQVNLQRNLYKSFLVANAVLLLISSASYFLKRQIDSKSKKFLENGGFSERMSLLRKNNRKT